MDQNIGAFATYNDARLEGSGSGPLAGLKFAAKDIFDIAGHVTGAGNPDWLETHEPARDTAPVALKLLDAGADLAGLTAMSELARGILGQNAHYGMPQNPRAPDRMPGGSSSGSASAVAGELVDFAIGSDTGGSIRIPASFCGLFVIKPTHGRIPLDGVFKYVPVFDTAGWFTRDAELLARVGEVLLDTDVPDHRPSRILVAEDLFALADPSVRAALEEPLRVMENLVPDVQRERFCPIDLQELYDNRHVIHGFEAWELIKDWFDEINPRLSYQTARICLKGADLTAEDASQAERVLAPALESMNELLSDGTVVCLPTTANAAWPHNALWSEIAESFLRSGKLQSAGTLLGAPQVSLPLATSDGPPVGLSLLSQRGSDEALLGFSKVVAQAFPVEIT